MTGTGGLKRVSIGKRYGSVHPDTGKSYTEMEYDYAIEQGIPVLVFAIDDNVKLASDKTEADEDKKDKLKKFRTKAMTNRLASIWASTEDLTGKLAISIMKAKTEIKRPGWQRAVDFDEASLRREIMTLKSENEQLANDLKVAREEISSLTEQNNIAFEDQGIKIEYHYYDYEAHRTRYGSVTTNLKEIFKVIATEMMDVSITENSIEDTIKTNFYSGDNTVHLNDSQFVKKILNQFRALNLINSASIASLLFNLFSLIFSLLSALNAVNNGMDNGHRKRDTHIPNVPRLSKSSLSNLPSSMLSFVMYGLNSLITSCIAL